MYHSTPIINNTQDRHANLTIFIWYERSNKTSFRWKCKL